LAELELGLNTFFSISTDILSVQKEQKLIPQKGFRASKYTKTAFAAGAPPRTTLRELTALPQTPIAGFGGAWQRGWGGETGKGKAGEEGKGQGLALVGGLDVPMTVWMTFRGTTTFRFITPTCPSNDIISS